MHPKERIKAVLSRDPVDRVPVDLWHTPEIASALRDYCSVTDDLDMYRMLGLDKIVWVFMDYNTDEGESLGSQVGADTSGLRTMWGTPLAVVRAGASAYEEFAGAPLAGYDTIDSLVQYPFWPDPDLFGYEDAVCRAERVSHDFAVIGPWVSLFEIYCQLRGLEQALFDLAIRPAYVDAVLDRVEEIQAKMMQRYFEKASSYLDLAFVSDDLAGQTSLLMSPTMWQRHLKPRLKRWCELIHSYGIRVFYHTDGAVEPLISSLIDCGIDVLNPIQHACPGMDLDHLKQKYGERVIFHGGIDNQSVLPVGTTDDVRAETRLCLETLGSDRIGYICCSCHNVQAGTSLENIFAMIETVRESG